jgi:NAD(P)-dependent dehydrogenase (short-subunit alcohol dehydrogenase family)
MSQTWFISGASRGIGFELTKIVASKGDIDFAGARNPSGSHALQQFAKENSNVHIVKHDAASETDSAALAQEVDKIVDGLDVVVANAAIATNIVKVTEIESEFIINHMKVNAIGPLLLFQALYPLLLKRKTRKFITISTMAASIGQLVPAHITVYGTSKAALNYLTKSIHREHHEEGFIVFPLHPGMVNTEGGQNVAITAFGWDRLPMSPEESAEACYKVIESATSEQGGRFWSYDGKELPW